MLPLVTVPPDILPSTAHVTPAHWLLVVGPALLVPALGAWLVATGQPGERRGLAAVIARAGSSLERVSGLPAWSAAGIGMGLLSLVVAFLGFMWDVAWHADFGRDRELFTVPHAMILLGLFGIGIAGVLAIAFATVSEAETGWRAGRLRIPYGALPLCLLGAGAAIGFPLDDLWHRTYGIDVTMWSPTHLMMIGGASLSPFGFWLLFAEAGNPTDRRLLKVVQVFLALALVIGLSTFQNEYDYGIPQWQKVFQPMLIMVAATIGLVACRAALGRGGAIVGALGFLALRVLTAFEVGPWLGHVVPRFPIYLGAALVIEAVFFIGRGWSSFRQALAAGVAVGTVGLATEWLWSEAWSYHPWPLSLLGLIWLAVLIAIPGAVVGMATGRVLALKRPGVPLPVVLGSLVLIAGLLALHLPARQVTPVTAELTTTPVGASQLGYDRDGTPSKLQYVEVGLTLTPADAAQGADRFELASWQGGSVKNTPLVSAGGGRYRSLNSVPTGGSWKTVVFLFRGDEMMGLPVSMPADRQYGKQAIQPVAARTSSFVPSRTLLVSEEHAGAAWPALLAYTVFVLMIAVWTGHFVLAYGRFGRGAPDPEPGLGRLQLARRKLT